MDQEIANPFQRPQEPFAALTSAGQAEPGSLYSVYMASRPTRPDEPIRSADPMLLDPDPFGDKAMRRAERAGLPWDSDYTAGLNVLGTWMSRDELETSDDGRRLLEIADRRKQGRRRDFFDAVVEGMPWNNPSNIPFLSLFASLGRSFSDAKLVSDAFHAMNAGEEIGDDMKMKTARYLTEQEEQRTGTFMSGVADLVTAAPGFMLEFAASEGVMGLARGAVARAAAKGTPEYAAHLAIDRSLKIATSDAVRVGFEAQFAKEAGGVASAAAIRSGWEGLADATASAAARAAVKESAVKALLPAYQSQLGGTGALAEKVLGSRIEVEMARQIAANSPSSVVRRGLQATWDTLRDRASAALLDFGAYGNSHLDYAASSSALRTFGDAIATLAFEAPVRGGMLMAPQLLVRPAVNAATGGAVPQSQLSLEAAAWREHDDELMSAAESIGGWLDFLEYASEQSGPGFSRLFRSAGLGLGIIPREAGASAGSFLSKWIKSTVGTTDDFLKGHIRNQTVAVRRALNAGEDLADDAIENFIRSRNPASLGAKYASAVGDNAEAFIRSAAAGAIKAEQRGMTYRTFTRYVLADLMARRQIGPREVTSMFARTGYDGLVEEMLEERYSDVAKGLFGLDERKDHSFASNLKQAWANLNPGWEQLATEALGFSVPMGVRSAIHAIQRGAGGGDLTRLENYCSALREFRGVNNVVEAKAEETHFAVAKESIQRMKDELRKETVAEDGTVTVTGAEEDLRRAEEDLAKMDRPTEEYRERATGALRSRVDDLKQRIAAAETQLRRERESVRGAGESIADKVLAFEALNTGVRADSADFRTHETPTAEQAGRAIMAHNVMTEGAADVGRILAESRKRAADLKSLPLHKRIASKALGLLGTMVTGDLSLAAYDPYAWAAADRGLNRTVVGQLADSWDAHYDAARDELRSEAAKAVAAGSAATSVEPTDAEIRERMKEPYEADARRLVRSYLAAESIRIFSRREMREQAAELVTRKFGSVAGHEAEVEKTVEDIATTALRILSSGSLESAQARDIARGVVRIAADSPFKDDLVLDATLKLSGFRSGIAAVMEVTPETDVRQACMGRSVPAQMLKDVAAIPAQAVSSGELDANQQKAILSLARALGYAPNVDRRGDGTLPLTEEAIRAINERTWTLCRMVSAVADPNRLCFRSADAARAEMTDPTRGGTPEFLHVERLANGAFQWREPGEDGRDVVRRAPDEVALRSMMQVRGYVQSDVELVLTPAREIRARDGAVLLGKMGWEAQYFAAAGVRTREDLLGHRVHPLFRERYEDRDGERTLVRLPVAEAMEIARREIANADRFRAVMSMPEEDRLAAFRETVDEPVERTRKRVADAEEDYKAVYGSEQDKNGYMPTIDKVLSAKGVGLPGSRMSYSAVLSSDRGFYTLNTRLLDYHDGAAFVFVDLNRDADYSGAILSRAISTGLVSRRHLWARDPQTREPGPFAGAIRDMVKRVSVVGADLAEAAYRAGRIGEGDALRAVVEDLVGGSDVTSPRLSTVVWLVRNVALGQAGREAAKSRSTGDRVAASALLSSALMQTPEAYSFLGFADLILGGDGFAMERAGGEESQVGIARLAAVFANPSMTSNADTFAKAMLPMRSDGTRMAPEEFMEKINAAAAYLQKGELDRQKMREAMDREPVEFIRELMKEAKLRTVADLRDFMKQVLTSAGVFAGRTSDLSQWSRDLERRRMLVAASDAELALLRQENEDLKQKLKDLSASTAAGANDEAASVSAKIDENTEKIRTIERAEPPVTPAVKQEDDTGLPPAPKAEDVDLTKLTPAGEADYDELDDSEGSGEFEDADSFEVESVPEPDRRAPTVDEEGAATTDPVVDDTQPVLSAEARRHVLWTAVHAASATGGRTVSDVRSAVERMFPSISDTDVSAIFDDFESFRQAATAASGEDEASLETVRELLDDEGRGTSDSEGWNDKAVAAYNALRPMLEMMELACPLAKRNFQGLVTVLREEVAALREDAEVAVGETAKALDLVNRLFNPRMENADLGAKTLPQRLAAHSSIIERTLGRGEDARRALDAVIRELLADRKSERGVTRPVAADVAAFLSFLGSLQSDGVRQSIMLLVSSSTNCDAVAIEDVYVPSGDGDGSTVKSGERMIRDAMTTRGSVSVNSAASAFMPLVGMGAKQVADLRETLVDATVGLTDATGGEAAIHSMPFRSSDEGFSKTTVFDEDDPTAAPLVVNSGAIPVNSLLYDLSVFERNAKAIAGVLRQVLGVDNALSRMLTSDMLFAHLRNKVTRSGTVVDALQVRQLASAFAPRARSDGKVDYPEALRVVNSILHEVEDEATRTKSRVTRDLVVSVVQNAFATGHLQQASVAFPGSHSSHTNEWLALLNYFTQSMPDTVVPSRPVPGRTVKDSSTAVAAPGQVPIVLRWMTAEPVGNGFDFGDIAERVAREQAERDFWSTAGERRFWSTPAGKDGSRGVPRRISRDFDNEAAGVRQGAHDFWWDGKQHVNEDERAFLTAEAARFVEARIQELGGREGIVDRCLQTMCWPNAARTPILARNLSVDFSPVELGAACRFSYEGYESDADRQAGKACADRRGMWYVPLFGGDHSCNNLVQVPLGRTEGVDFLSAARQLNDASGVSLMLNDTKRSAITSADAASVPMIGAEVEFDSSSDIPVPKSAKFGECRMHVGLNLAQDEAGEEFSQEAMHGQTLCAGPGPQALRRMAKNPKFSISKFHAIGIGENLEFEKSASSIVGDDSAVVDGLFPPGTMPRAFADHILGYRSPEDRRLSADTITDEDSYKVGPLKSRVYSVATGVDANGRPTGTTTFLDFIKKALRAGTDPKAILDMQVRVAKGVGSAARVGEPVRLGDALPGLDIVPMKGLNRGGSASDRAFGISYRSDSMMALKVANIAHSSKPHVGGNGKNYTLDALAKAVEQTVRKGVAGTDPAATPQSQVLTTLYSYAVLAGAVATDPESVEQALRRDVDDPQGRLGKLLASHADPNGIEFRNLRARMVAKRIRESILAPVNKINATLVSCGATLSKDKKRVLDHSASEMRRDVHRGSIVFAPEETAKGGLYEGFKRRLALAEVNNSDVSWRYGWFLDEEKFAAKFGLDITDDRRVMETLEQMFTAVRIADQEYSEAKAAAAAGPENAAAQTAADAAAAKRRGARRGLMSMFLDHHGDSLEDKSWTKRDRRGNEVVVEYWNTVCFEDLFAHDGHGGTRFDRTAVQLGQDRVKLDAYDYLTGELDEQKSRGKTIFLGGSAFEAPRTPSYNGGMWLQFVRASFPVKETARPVDVPLIEDGAVKGTARRVMYSVGADGIVALDPQTLDILGCDNDGDESALSAYSPDADGIVRCGDVAELMPELDLTAWDDNTFVSADALETADNRRKLLEAAASRSPNGIRFIRRAAGRADGRRVETGGYEFTRVGMRSVANQLHQGLLDMARDLEVPPGEGRRNFASVVSGLTKAQPFDDSDLWATYEKRGGEKVLVGGLMTLMPPDIFADASQTVGDPEVQEKVSLSADKAKKARGAIVQSASSMLVAYLSGCFEERTVRRQLEDGTYREEANPYALFDAGVTPDAIQSFMRHFDGLSNATFDDVKERICQRLGLTPETVDMLVADLLSGKTPTTDAEWKDVLERYVLSVRDRTPDGKYVWALGMTSPIGLEDKSRMFMAKVSDRLETEWRDTLTAVVFGGARSYRARMEALLRFTGLAVRVDPANPSRRFFVATEPKNTLRGILGAKLSSMKGIGYVLEAAAHGSGGCNDASGYLMWLAGSAAGSLAQAKSGAASDLGRAQQVLDAHVPLFERYMAKRRAWKKAKEFATALNFSQSDPGANNAASRAAEAAAAYAEVAGFNWPALSKDQRTVVAWMRQATRMAYSCGLVNAETPESRAHSAVAAARSAVSSEDRPAVKLNEDFIAALRRRGDSEAAVLAEDVMSVVRDAASADSAGARTLVQDRDPKALRDAMTSVPYVVAAIQTMPLGGIFRTEADKERVLRAIAAAGLPNGQSPVLGFRRAVESLFSCLYTMVATSAEGVKHPGITYFGQRTDSAYSLTHGYEAAGNGRSVADYGIGATKLATLFQTFAVRDPAAMERIQRAVAEFMDGTFDKMARTHRYRVGGKSSGYERAKSFVLSMENVRAMRGEIDAARGAAGRAGWRFLSRSEDDFLVLEHVLKAVADATGADPEKLAIRPSELFNQLIPLYVAVTSPVAGTPSYEQFSSSILAALPGVYAKWSARQVLNDRGYETTAGARNAKKREYRNFVDLVAALNLAPVNRTATRAACAEYAANVLHDAGMTPGLLDQAMAGLGPVRAVRSNPDNRHAVDMFAFDGLLFKTARLASLLGGEAADMAKTHQDELESGAPSTDPVEVDAPEPAPAGELASLADAVRETLGSIPGLRVEMDGSTMVIRGTLSGSAVGKRRVSSGNVVNTVIRVDIGATSPMRGTKVDVNSPSVAVSVANALRTAGILDISAEDFLTKLTVEEREALVARAMPSAFAGGAGGAALRAPVWSVDAKGVLTLAGAIRLRKAESKTLYHEYFHSMVGMMRSLGFISDEEGKRLSKVFGKARSSAEAFDEERAADRFAAYVEARMAGKKPRGAVAEFFAKIYDFLRRLVSALEAKGFRYDERIVAGGEEVGGEDMLFGMVLTGMPLDSLDSPKWAKAQLKADRMARSDAADREAAERLSGAVARTYEDRSRGVAEAKDAHDRFMKTVHEWRFPKGMLQSVVGELVARRSIPGAADAVVMGAGGFADREAAFSSTDAGREWARVALEGAGVVGDSRDSRWTAFKARFPGWAARAAAWAKAGVPADTATDPDYVMYRYAREANLVVGDPAPEGVPGAADPERSNYMMKPQAEGPQRRGTGNLDSLFRDHDSIVVFDTETSGPDTAAHRIVEIAAIRYVRGEDGQPVRAGEMSTLVKLPFGVRMDEGASAVNNITDEMLAASDVPQMAAALAQFETLLEGEHPLLVAHNAAFDSGMLSAAFLRERGSTDALAKCDWLDTLTVARDRAGAYDESGNWRGFKLGDLLAEGRYGTGADYGAAHRALADTEPVMDVLRGMDRERDDLGRYVNVFGYLPKYGAGKASALGALMVEQPMTQRGGMVDEGATAYAGLREAEAEDVPETAPADTTFEEDVSIEVANSLGPAIAPGNGIFGDSPALVGRMTRLGHGIAQAIALGFEDIDPLVRSSLEANSDLSVFRVGDEADLRNNIVTAEIERVVRHGVFSAAESLGVSLLGKEKHLRNLAYANMLHAYGDLAAMLGYPKGDKRIRHAKAHRGEATKAKQFVSEHDIAAFLLTSGGLSYREIAQDTMDRLFELRDLAKGRAKVVENLNHFIANLTRLANKTSYKGDPLRQLQAGIETAERDGTTGARGRFVASKKPAGAVGERNKREYQLGEPVVQEALEMTLRTAYTLSAAKTLYSILGIEPESLEGGRLPEGFGNKVSVVNRRSRPADDSVGLDLDGRATRILPPVPNGEVARALGVSLDDLLDGSFVDPFSEVGLYANAPGEWLASTVRETFGGKPLRDMFQEEHRLLKGATDRFRRVQNWWAMYLGENCAEGTPLLAVRKDKGHFVFDNGHQVYDETGTERTGFDNYSYRFGRLGKWRGITTDVALDRADKEMIDFWLKSAYYAGMGGKYVYTGVRELTFSFENLVRYDGRQWSASDFSKEEVARVYNGSRVGRMAMDAYIALAELSQQGQLPDAVVDGGMYDRLAAGIAESLNETAAEYMRNPDLDPRDANASVLRKLAARKLVRYVRDDHGNPRKGCVVVSCDEVERLFKSSAAHSKLVSAGRDASMLTTKTVVGACMKAYNECTELVRKSPWMSEGDGRHFNMFGSMMPFLAGNGVFKYWAQKIGRDEKKDVSERLNEYEQSFIDTLRAADQSVTPGQLSMLHDIFGTGADQGQGLLAAIAAGEYSEGTAKAQRTGLAIEPKDASSSHRVAEIIYRRLCEIAWADRGNNEAAKRLGGRGSVARMIDFYDQNAGERVSMAAVGVNADQMYAINGVRAANHQCFHAVNAAMASLARTVQFRNTFVNFLFTEDATGNPVAYAKPSLVNRKYVDDGIPEEVWEYAARWWAAANGLEYREGDSGRVNAARLYDEIIASNKTGVVKGRHFRALDGTDRANLSSVSDFAAVDDDTVGDDVNARNWFNGGEAYGYAKMLFNIPRVAGGRAQCALLNKVSSYSKTLSVQHSAFFPIATRLESPVAAVGAWTMLFSNLAPSAARRLSKQAAAFDEVFHTSFGATVNGNFVGFKDIIRMMDTDDPFLADAIEMCTAMGISLSDRLVNPYEEDKSAIEADMNRVVAICKANFGDKVAKHVRGVMSGFLFRGSERAFSYALNATKIATALQIAQKVESDCRKAGRAFNLVKELRPYSAYINAEIGGIDPLRYAWANPRFRRLMNCTMFSWEWTKGAWAAGGGEIIEEALGGGHFSTPEMRATMAARWLRMYGAVMIGVPALFQAIAKLIGLLFGVDDDDDKWLTWQNEGKYGPSAFNITPLLKAAARANEALGDPRDSAVVRAAGQVGGTLLGGFFGAALSKAALGNNFVALVGGIGGALYGARGGGHIGQLIPAYTGRDKYNTTGKRKFYMHFGKQGWEFFRWFDDPIGQFFAKQSMTLQRFEEGMLGYNLASREYDLPFTKKGFAERWFLPTADSATTNLLRAFVPFSWSAAGTYGDAGFLSMLGPIGMGTSYKASLKLIEGRLTHWAFDDKAGHSFGGPGTRSRYRSVALVRDVLRDAKANGMDPDLLLTEGTGLAAKKVYESLFDQLPLDGESAEHVDFEALGKTARAAHRLGLVRDQALSSLKAKMVRRGRNWKTMNEHDKAAFKAALRGAFGNPFTFSADDYDALREGDPRYRLTSDGTRQAGKGGEALSNFLATDGVPETLFGIPVVVNNYTEKDLAFFEEFPEAGGYYDMGSVGEPDSSTRGAVEGGDTFAGHRKAIRALRTDKERRDYWNTRVLPMLHLPAAFETPVVLGYTKDMKDAAKATYENSRREAMRKGDPLLLKEAKARYTKWLKDEPNYVEKSQAAATNDLARHYLRTSRRPSSADLEMAYRAFVGDPMGARELLSRNYGDSGIAQRALAARLSAWGRNADSSATLWGTRVFTPGVDSPRGPNNPFVKSTGVMELFGFGNPKLPAAVVKSIADSPELKGGKRAFHEWSSGASYVPATRIGAAVHENGGHGLAPVTDDGVNTDMKDSVFKRIYYLSDNAETSAFLGNLRRQVWAAQKRDIASPGVLQAVLKDAWDNPTRYLDMSEDVRMGLMQYHDLKHYSGDDERIKKRRDEIEALFKDEKYLNQHASIQRTGRGTKTEVA